MRLRPLLLFAPLLPSLAFAAEPARDTPAAPAPPAVRNGGATAAEPPEGAIEPEVTITTRGTEIHEEYRVNGQLYKIKVIPAKGKPYYLVYDEPGKVRRSDIEPATIIPQWVIKRF
jgi:hypothetical protein